jgi:serine/threonine-protein kinase RsbW
MSPLSPAAPGVPPAGARSADRHWIVTLDNDRLREARKRAGRSQEQLAYESGVSLTTIGRLERQVRPHCHFRTRALIAAVLGVHARAITAVLDGQPDGQATATTTQAITAPPADLVLEPKRTTCSQAFPARADQVREARALLGRLLAHCPLADDALLICSELATNAVQHSASARPGGTFTVRAEVLEDGYAWIEVEDQGGRWIPHADSDEDGRGLAIVDSLAADWDIRGDDTGRVICARIDWRRRPWP